MCALVEDNDKHLEKYTDVIKYRIKQIERTVEEGVRDRIGIKVLGILTISTVIICLSIYMYRAHRKRQLSQE